MAERMKVLVANRGEIACRIFHTLREMEIPSVAVFTDVDRDAPHVWLADQAIELGPAPGYLDPERILAAARQSGTTAIHPGYGFLAQNAPFARACIKAGLTFIGPSPESMLALGEKRNARASAEALGIPVIPGSSECDTLEAARAAAKRAGYPILLKAAGGGGGKGMRRVNSARELAEAFAGAGREALAAFADDRLLVEKLVEPARHVEVQIVGDGRDAVALGERECSLQRRYQKVIEESPCIAITDRTRRSLLTEAVALARASGYAGAGTVEFLVGPDEEHYFLEVNTRLQVEHPVTEMLTGIDLVRAQIEVARGGPLPEPVAPRGHAIEARLYAEDPYRDFLPASGKILMLAWPVRPQVRIDTGIRQGMEVTPFYDPLLAKLIAWGRDREEARRRLVQALRETTLLGLVTNQSFLLDILESDFFVRGETTTTILESQAWAAPDPPEEVRLAAMKALATPAGMTGEPGPASGGGHGDRFTPWRSLGGFRLGRGAGTQGGAGTQAG
jgi:acetyl/propionyl-CoA carboxylase alpha subunit